MQMLTPQQTQALMKFVWEGIDKAAWAAIAYGVYKGRKMLMAKLKHLSDMLETASVVPAQLATHTTDDQAFQVKAIKLIEDEGAATRRRIDEVVSGAIKEHVSTFHGSSAD